MNASDLAHTFGRVLPSVVFVGLVLGTAAAADSASAQASAARTAMLNPVIYPAKDQSPKQQEHDKYECYDWAKKQSGFDPAQMSSSQPVAQAPTSQPTTTSQQASSGGVNGSMVRGAAGGAAVAELAHKDAGRGAAVGVLGSAVMQRVKSQQAAQANQSAQQRQQQQQMQQQQQQMAEQMAAREQQRTNYARAFNACMEARGYVLK
jgi:hypothetical protein